MAATHIVIYPKPGVTIYLSGGTHGFRSGPVPMRADHAAELAAHVMTEAEKLASDTARAATEKPGAEPEKASAA